jgi:hypothetical protein
VCSRRRSRPTAQRRIARPRARSPPPMKVAPKGGATEGKQETSEDSGLSDGEIAGVAIGAGVGGIVVLGIVALVIRSLMFKGAKPVFTCLEKSNTEKKPPV